MVAPGGLVGAAQIALVLPAQGAGRVAGLGSVFGGGNGLGVLLGLGEVDGNHQVPIGRGGGPQAVLLNAVHPDVVGGAAQAIIIVSGGLGAFLVEGLEAGRHLRGPGGQAGHELGVKLVPGVLVVLQPALFHGPGAKALQGSGRAAGGLSLRDGGEISRAQQGQEAVGGISPVLGSDEGGLDAVFDEAADFQINVGFHTGVILSEAGRGASEIILLQSGAGVKQRCKRRRSAPANGGMCHAS